MGFLRSPLATGLVGSELLKKKKQNMPTSITQYGTMDSRPALTSDPRQGRSLY